LSISAPQLIIGLPTDRFSETHHQTSVIFSIDSAESARSLTGIHYICEGELPISFSLTTPKFIEERMTGLVAKQILKDASQ